jgi:hypothetical protein
VRVGVHGGIAISLADASTLRLRYRYVNQVAREYV